MRNIRNQDYRTSRYLLIYLPAALLLIGVILIILERSRIIEKKFIGYEGEQAKTPRVEIITPETGQEDMFNRRHNPLRFTETEKRTTRQKEEDPGEKEKEIEIPDEMEVKPDKYFRSYPSHARVPYSEDYVILKMVKPEYPREAMNKGIEGYVIIEVLIGKDGKVKEAWTRKVYGSESFREASIEAIQEFVFRPKLIDGKPQEFWISFIFKFTFFGDWRTYR